MQIENKKIRKMYNQQIVEKYSNNYEFNRWFKTSRLSLDYFMTYKSINYHLNDLEYNNYLEFGPGPGTWTRLFYRHNKEANFDLIDISEEMKKQFGLEMRSQDNVNYRLIDITKYDSDKKYDLFFSSRAIEYLEEKEVLLKKIFSFLRNGGQGMIITKNPHYGLFKKEKNKRWQHRGQLSADFLKDSLEKVGFSKVEIYPVIFRIPVIDRFTNYFSRLIFKKLYKKKISKRFLFLIESYIIKFHKV
jgi:ubiquinone/menaquinone biosynthesis C-methylase UbiE